MYFNINADRLISVAQANGMSLMKLIKSCGVLALVQDYELENVRWALKSHFAGNNPSRFVKEYWKIQATFTPLLTQAEAVSAARTKAILSALLSYEEE